MTSDRMTFTAPDGTVELEAEQGDALEIEYESPHSDELLSVQGVVQEIRPGPNTNLKLSNRGLDGALWVNGSSLRKLPELEDPGTIGRRLGKIATIRSVFGSGVTHPYPMAQQST